MIRFALQCSQDHAFEGWFRDGAAFDAQAGDGVITCPVCGDSAVRKAMMAPAVVRSAARSAPASAPVPAAPTMTPDQVKAAMMVGMLRKMREHVEKNFENVGDRFPEEARRIHYGEAAEREIYGRATPEEAKELHEEGVPVRPLPELPKLDG
jgi:hypothetical protein